MKTTGAIRRIDDLARLCIPKEIRKQLGLLEGAEVEIYLEGDKVIIKKLITEELSK